MCDRSRYIFSFLLQHEHDEYGSTIPRLLMVLIVFAVLADDAAADYLSIKYSQKSQIRTSLTWMQTRPNLITQARKRADGSIRVGVPGARAVDQSLIDKNPIYARAGKLFFTDPEGSIKSCSASFAGSDSLVATAAHCVMTQEGDWNRDFIFIRSYGSSDQEIYAVTCIALPGVWGEYGQDTKSHDYAFLRTFASSQVGSFSLNGGAPPESLQIIGYADKFLEGQGMLTMNFSVDQSNSNKLGSPRNELGHGNSGSPWINRYTQELFSVSSHYDESGAATLWGPRLKDAAQELMKYAQNGCERM